MSQKKINELIKRFSGQSNILTIPRIYIELLDGDIEAALFLSQCVYWMDKTKNKYGFYKSVLEWQAEIGLSRFKVRRCSKACSQWVSQSLHRANGAPTLHYKVDITSLSQALSDLLVSGKSENCTMDLLESEQSDLLESGKCLTETTQEITTEIKDSAPARAPAEKKPKEKKETKPNRLYPIAAAIIDVCGMDMKIDTHRGMSFKAAEKLADATIPATPEIIKQHYGPGGWWWTTFWIGKDKKEHPTPSKIVDNWGKWGAQAKPSAQVMDGSLDHHPKNSHLTAIVARMEAERLESEKKAAK